MISYEKLARAEHGVSLIETLVVVSIIAVVASLALMQRGSANEQLQRQNVAGELKVAFERARFDSVKRRADGSTVAFANVYIEATQLTLITDVNQDGDLADAGDSVIMPFPANITITPRSGLTLPLTVSFNRRGEPNITDATFVVCNGTCDFSNDTTANASIIHVTATGTVNLLPGGSTVANFAVPSVSPVPPGTSIRTDTYISPTPTP